MINICCIEFSKEKKNKSPLCRAGERDQLIQCLKQEQEDLHSMPRIHPIKGLGMVHGVFLQSQHWRGEDQQTLGAHWSASLAYLASSRLVRDPISRNNGNGT